MSLTETTRGAEGAPVRKRNTAPRPIPRPIHEMTRWELLLNWAIFLGGGGLILLGGALLPALLGGGA